MYARKSAIILFMVVLLAACNTHIPTESPESQATNTNTPTLKLSLTPTLTSTPTTKPSLTPTLTYTPTNTPTPTPLPLAGPVTGKAMTRLGKSWVNDLTFSPNGKMLYVATSIGVYLYQLESMQLNAFISDIANVADTAFVDDKTLVVGDSNGTTAVWDIGDKPKVRETLQRNDPVEALGVSDDGSILIVELGWEASGRSVSSFVRVVKWDRANPEEVHKVSHEIGSEAKFSPSGN